MHFYTCTRTSNPCFFQKKNVGYAIWMSGYVKILEKENEIKKREAWNNIRTFSDHLFDESHDNAVDLALYIDEFHELLGNFAGEFFHELQENRKLARAEIWSNLKIKHKNYITADYSIMIQA